MYYIKYHNNGRTEKTPPFADRKTAEKTAAFLKYQGASHVRILRYFS